MKRQQTKGKATPKFGIPSAPEIIQKVPTVHSGHAHTGSTNHLAPAFSFLHFDPSPECPSTWPQDNMKSLFDAMRVASSMTWKQVQATGGHGKNAQGIAFKVVNPKQAKRNLPENLAEDIDLAEIRITKKARIFGVRSESIFYVIWLDKDHQVFPE